MWKLTGWVVLAAGSAIALPVAVKAQVFPAHGPGCCESCTLPAPQCQCTRTRPVVQTQLQARAVTVMQPVTETRVRQEQCVQQVPVTTVENVTVDEGGYQMVWVPKPVTRQVAKTVMTQKVTVRDVPYQVTTHVPRTMTQMVPVQTVTHVTETVPMAAAAPLFIPAPRMTMAAPCNACGPVFGPPVMSALPASIVAPPPQTALGPTHDHGPWHPIPGRTEATPAAAPVNQPVPTPMDDPAPLAPQKSSKRFRAAPPSAATVWAARNGAAAAPRGANVAANDAR